MGSCRLGRGRRSVRVAPLAAPLAVAPGAAAPGARRPPPWLSPLHRPGRPPFAAPSPPLRRAYAAPMPRLSPEHRSGRCYVQTLGRWPVLGTADRRFRPPAGRLRAGVRHARPFGDGERPPELQVPGSPADDLLHNTAVTGNPEFPRPAPTPAPTLPRRRGPAGCESASCPDGFGALRQAEASMPDHSPAAQSAPPPLPRGDPSEPASSGAARASTRDGRHVQPAFDDSPRGKLRPRRHSDPRVCGLIRVFPVPGQSRI